MENEKKYKELVGKIKKAYLYAQTDSTKAVLEDILPELAESEDEKIRKWLIGYFNQYIIDGMPQVFGNGLNVKDVIAWLEKQQSVEEIVGRCKDSWYNEGKIAGMAEGLTDDEKYQQGWHDALEAIKEKADNANKVEPKFHEGEWIVWQDKCCKVNYNGCGYELVDQNGLSTSLEYGTVDENAHLWDTTKDAKDGDVLVSDNIVFIFNKIHDIWIKCHCSLYEDDSFYGGDFDLMHIKYGKEVFPATKDQRDTLLKAMADAGYELDAEKKELKKIDQKPAWNEEDEKNLKRAIWYVEHSAINVVKDTMLSEWLKSIKERVQPQPRREWSEEDEKIALSIEQVMNCASLLNLVPEKIEKVRAWLKSIKGRVQSQKQWKPSDAQTKVCKEVYADILSAKGFDLGTINSELNRLEEQLKKLKE